MQYDSSINSCINGGQTDQFLRYTFCERRLKQYLPGTGSRGTFGTRGFRTAAPTIWNSLPANVRFFVKLYQHSAEFPTLLIATHLSASDSLRPWRYINLFIYLLTLTCPGHWISRYGPKWPILCWCLTATRCRPPRWLCLQIAYHPACTHTHSSGVTIWQHMLKGMAMGNISHVYDNNC